MSEYSGISKVKRAKIKIHDLLRQNVGHKYKRWQIAEKFGYNEKIVRSAISELNLEGVPIVSLGDGFCYTNDKSVIDQAARKLDKTARSVIKRAAALRGITSQEYAEQLAIEFSGYEEREPEKVSLFV